MALFKTSTNKVYHKSLRANNVHIGRMKSKNSSGKSSKRSYSKACCKEKERKKRTYTPF